MIDTLLFALIGFAFYVIMFIADRIWGDRFFRRGMTEGERALTEEVNRLKIMVDLLSIQVKEKNDAQIEARVRSMHQDDKIRSQGIEILDLRRDLSSAQAEVTALKAELEKKRMISVPVPVPPFVALPMGVICGEPDFCMEDMQQLSRARIWYRAIEGSGGGSASGEEVAEEFQRRRHDGTLYKWLLISAHGTHRGISLSDGVKPREWWQPIVEGVKVVMLANCEGQSTGDVLAGLVDRVVLFYGERNTVDITAFVYSFWREMMHDDNPDRAFQVAINEVPQIRRWVDIRQR